MRLLKIVLLILVSFAAYKASRHIILGIPVDPKKTLTEWSQQINTETPKKITDSITLIGVRFDWYEPRGIANMYDEEFKRWSETYEVTGPRDPSTLEQARDVVIGIICHDKTHQKILNIMNMEALLRTPKETIAVDQPTAFRLGSSVRILYPIEKTVSVGKASCIGR